MAFCREVILIAGHVCTPVTASVSWKQINVSALLAVYNGYEFTVHKLQNFFLEQGKKAIWDTKFCVKKIYVQLSFWFNTSSLVCCVIWTIWVTGLKFVHGFLSIAFLHIYTFKKEQNV